MILLLLALVQDKEWFPVEKGTSWTYVVDGKESTTVARGAGKVGEIECMKFETANGSDSQTEYFAVDDKGVTLHKIETWRSETPGESLPEPAIPRLKFGLKKGESWSWKGSVGGFAQKATYTHDGEEEIKVAAGTYLRVKIKTEAESDQGKYSIERWYAKGVGLVKGVVTMGGREQKTELKKFEKATK